MTVEADTIITAIGPGLDDKLFKDIKENAPEVYLIGSDDNESGSIMNAIGTGHRIAKAV